MNHWAVHLKLRNVVNQQYFFRNMQKIGVDIVSIITGFLRGTCSLSKHEETSVTLWGEKRFMPEGP